jgi:hypothetical protein
MKTMSSAGVIRSYVTQEYIEPARRKGVKHVRVVAGEVHRALKLKNRVPNVCNVLTSRTLLKENDLALEGQEGPPSGMSTRMTYTYRLLDDKEPRDAPTGAVGFDKLRGLLKEALHSLGGGEAFLRGERTSFFGPRSSGEK